VYGKTPLGLQTSGCHTKAATVKGVTKAKELASILNLLPYNHKNQLLLAGGVLNAKRGINKFY
jgi:hypothetical protein